MALTIAQYMLYGGTNWGGIGFTNTYTSYDYVRSGERSKTFTQKFKFLHASFLPIFHRFASQKRKPFQTPHTHGKLPASNPTPSDDVMMI